MDAPSPAAATAAPGEAPALELDGLAGTRASAAAVPTAHDAATTHAGTSGEPPAEDAPPPAVTSPRAALPLKEPAPDDFLLLKVVGRGAFGKVLQVAHKRSPRVYAMKVMDKKFLSSSRGYLEMAQIERDVMTRLSHPYIVSLRYAFQTRDKLFLVSDFCAGGELFHHLSQQGMVSEDTARVYLAEIVLALEYLHSLGIVHRDLKPENILLDAEGHIRVTDYGLAKDLAAHGPVVSAFPVPPASAAATEAAPVLDVPVSSLRTGSIVGTEEYYAPEMVALAQGSKGSSYGVSVDWWALGCLAYEMLMGHAPFKDKSRKELFRKIMTEKPSFPPWLSAAACSFVRSLLERAPEKRLGCSTPAPEPAPPAPEPVASVVPIVPAAPVVQAAPAPAVVGEAAAAPAASGEAVPPAGDAPAPASEATAAGAPPEGSSPAVDAPSSVTSDTPAPAADVALAPAPAVEAAASAAEATPVCEAPTPPAPALAPAPAPAPAPAASGGKAGKSGGGKSGSSGGGKGGKGNSGGSAPPPPPALFGVAALKAHPFFKGIDWAKLAARAVPPPVPIKLSGGATDTSNFDTFFTSQPITIDDTEPQGGAAGAGGGKKDKKAAKAAVAAATGGSGDGTAAAAPAEASGEVPAVDAPAPAPAPKPKPAAMCLLAALAASPGYGALPTPKLGGATDLAALPPLSLGEAAAPAAAGGSAGLPVGGSPGPVAAAAAPAPSPYAEVTRGLVFITPTPRDPLHFAGFSWVAADVLDELVPGADYEGWKGLLAEPTPAPVLPGAGGKGKGGKGGGGGGVAPAVPAPAAGGAAKPKKKKAVGDVVATAPPAKSEGAEAEVAAQPDADKAEAAAPAPAPAPAAPVPAPAAIVTPAPVAAPAPAPVPAPAPAPTPVAPAPAPAPPAARAAPGPAVAPRIQITRDIASNAAFPALGGSPAPPQQPVAKASAAKGGFAAAAAAAAAKPATLAAIAAKPAVAPAVKAAPATAPSVPAFVPPSIVIPAPAPAPAPVPAPAPAPGKWASIAAKAAPAPAPPAAPLLPKPAAAPAPADDDGGWSIVPPPVSFASSPGGGKASPSKFRFNPNAAEWKPA